MYSLKRQNGEYFLEGEILDGTDDRIQTYRGYTGIGIYEPCNAVNVGTLWRSALALGVNFIFTIGGNYKKQKSDTCNSTNHQPLFRFRNEEEFFETIPRNATVCAIDNNRNIRIPRSLHTYKHPEQCIYLLGKESGGLPNSIIKRANNYVYIPTRICLNVATTGSLIIYDRLAKTGFFNESNTTSQSQ